MPKWHVLWGGKSCSPSFPDRHPDYHGNKNIKRLIVPFTKVILEMPSSKWKCQSRWNMFVEINNVCFFMKRECIWDSDSWTKLSSSTKVCSPLSTLTAILPWVDLRVWAREHNSTLYNPPLGTIFLRVLYNPISVITQQCAHSCCFGVQGMERHAEREMSAGVMQLEWLSHALQEQTLIIQELMNTNP